MVRFRYMLAVAAAAAGLASPAQAGSELAALYGDRILFDVMRDGRPVGTHAVSFAPRGDRLHVEAAFELSLRLLGVAYYRYRYVSRSEWEDGRLVRLTAVTDDNGARSRVTATDDGGGLRVEGPAGTLRLPAGTFPTDHWHPGVLGARHVLNTITGAPARVRIEDRGVEAVATATGTVEARRWDYTGDLRNSVWYDAQGRWVRMRFTAADGSSIDYVCRVCGVGAAPASPTRTES